MLKCLPDSILSNIKVPSNINFNWIIYKLLPILLFWHIEQLCFFKKGILTNITILIMCYAGGTYFAAVANATVLEIRAWTLQESSGWVHMAMDCGCLPSQVRPVV